jgi:cysteinyl-tRNA synthetase
MSWKLLGETFDIHGGGIDLVFPHHENEIAQSRCAFHTPVMANFWMHNGFLQVEGEKMAKSAGNFVTIHELLNDWPGEVLRFNMLRTHYRQPIDWTLKGLEESEKILDEWYALAAAGAPSVFSDRKIALEVANSVLEALCDDLNTPRAISELHQIRNSAVHGAGVERVVSLIHSLRFLGLLTLSDKQWRAAKEKNLTIDKATIDKMISARNAARKAKNYVESDRIRDELAAMGVVLKDSKDGTTWEVAR